MPPSTGTPPHRDAWFATTHWTVIASAKEADSPVARAALEAVCREYWYPLYAYVRRLGRTEHDAQDLVQGFFAACLERDFLRSVDRTKGRFRSFLLVALKRYLANEWEREQTQKRGGHYTFLSLDSLNPEERYAQESVHQLTADKLYDRRWATVLLDRVLDQLRDEYAQEGRANHFEALKEFLGAGGRGTPYADLGQTLGISEGAVKVTVHRLRKRYRALLESAIADTVTSPDDIDDERRHLIAALGG